MSIKWNLEKLNIEAKKYRTRAEFQILGNSAYQSAYRKNILDIICTHMPDDMRKRPSVKKKWTKESLLLEALKYNSRSEFWEKNCSAYVTAAKLLVLEEVCGHMVSRLSKPEQDLREEIKRVYPRARKIRDKNFELDIYVEEIKKAVEFDGTYWHSLKGLKRSRPTWPEEMLKNYHTIKDNYFKEKGISVFHIKEKDWIKDKQSCINRCFEFLKKVD